MTAVVLVIKLDDKKIMFKEGISYLKSIFARRIKSEIYFHEDDYCQIEILPVENLDFCLEQAGLIDESAEAHYDGFGYTEAFVRKENPISLHDKKISAIFFNETLSGILPVKYDEVFTGYASYRVKCEHTSAFGYDDKTVVVFYDEDDGFIINIWLDLGISQESDIALVQNFFIALSKLGDFIIADWGWCFVEKINNHEKIEQYLQNRFDRNRNFRFGGSDENENA